MTDLVRTSVLEVLAQAGPEGLTRADLEGHARLEDASDLGSVLRGLVREGLVNRASGRRFLLASVDEPPGRGGRYASRVASSSREPSSREPSARAPGFQRGPARVAPKFKGRKVSGEPKVDAFAQIRRGETNARRLLDQIARAVGVDGDFARDTLVEAAAMRAPDGPDPTCLDLTSIPLVTIDGADAKDFDDAVFAERIGREVRLVVAIADVSFYVREGSLLDDEARARGSSVYLPGRVYPMLPAALSDDLCSLRPHVFRRCAWVSMIVQPDGSISNADAGFGVMRSAARLTYEQAQGFFDGVRDAVPALPAVHESLRTLRETAKRLHARRRARGLLDLDLPEAGFALTDDGERVDTIHQRPRLETHRLVEECMLATNETVADLLAGQHWPVVYRLHDAPSDIDVGPIHRVLESAGVRTRLSENPSVDELDRLLQEVAGLPAGRVISWLLLRSLPRARYGIEDTGHYGIGAGRYAHFTSPIRRYPDLMVHRLLRASLAARPPRGKEKDALCESLREGASLSNRGEERATLAERSAQRVLKARYMMDHIGEVFEASVSDVLAVGAFVSVDEPFVDGLVPMRMLGRDFWELDTRYRQLTGARSGETIGVADRLWVRCIEASVEDGRVTFARVAPPGEQGAPRHPERYDEGAAPTKRTRNHSKRPRS